LIPLSVALLIVSPAAGFAAKRIPHKRIVQAGLIVSFVALLVLRFSLRENMRPAMLIPGLALYGIGMGLVLSQINNLTLSAVPVRDAGEASGVTNTFRQVGSSLGAAIIGAILLHLILAGLGGHQPPRAAMALAFGAPLADKHLIDVRRVATTYGIREAMLYGAAFVILGLIVSHWLPMRAQVRTED
jgi:MFS family permease